MATAKPVCKAFSLPANNGRSLVVGETVERNAIEVSICHDHHVIASVMLSAEQFELLCRMDSPYSGLEVFKPVEEAGPEVVQAAIAVLDEEDRRGE